MNIINYISQSILPLLFLIITLYGILSGGELYSAFVEGAAEGLRTVFSILPSLMGLLMAVGIFRASGAMDMIISLLSPISRLTGFPEELMSLGTVKMFSSSAAVGLLLDIFKSFGPDSIKGMAASIMMSCTETVFYTLSIYSAAAGVKKTRYTALCAVTANISGIAVSYMLTLFLFSK